jgi:hypothetical protein
VIYLLGHFIKVKLSTFVNKVNRVNNVRNPSKSKSVNTVKIQPFIAQHHGFEGGISWTQA